MQSGVRPLAREVDLNVDSTALAIAFSLVIGTMVTDTLFERAQDGVYRLMSRDSYVRWHNERRVERDRLAAQNQRYSKRLRNASLGLGMLNHEWSKHTCFGKVQTPGQSISLRLRDARF